MNTTKKAVTRVLILIQGIITAALAIVVSYGILTGQF
jgi:hypothetical protein